VVIMPAGYWDERDRFWEKYEKWLREQAVWDILMHPRPRRPNECPKCFEEGRRTKGILVEETEFTHSKVFHFVCPRNGTKWVWQIKKG